MTMDAIFNEEMPRARLAVLLKHFSQIDDDREPWRVVYPLAEVLLLLTCATIASCDDLEDIVAWGEQHLDFLRRFSEFHFGIPCVRWLQTLVNRVDPVLFGRCFESWIKELWPDRHDLIAIDGKTSRRTHDKRKGLKALHTLSAYASNADYLLALKGNHPRGLRVSGARRYSAAGYHFHSPRTYTICDKAAERSAIPGGSPRHHCRLAGLAAVVCAEASEPALPTGWLVSEQPDTKIWSYRLATPALDDPRAHRHAFIRRVRAAGTRERPISARHPTLRVGGIACLCSPADTGPLPSRGAGTINTSEHNAEAAI
jgi:DDE_Tnp_1-associated